MTGASEICRLTEVVPTASDSGFRKSFGRPAMVQIPVRIDDAVEGNPSMLWMSLPENTDTALDVL